MGGVGVVEHLFLVCSERASVFFMVLLLGPGYVHR